MNFSAILIIFFSFLIHKFPFFSSQDAFFTLDAGNFPFFCWNLQFFFSYSFFCFKHKFRQWNETKALVRVVGKHIEKRQMLCWIFTFLSSYACTIEPSRGTCNIFFSPPYCNTFVQLTHNRQKFFLWLSHRNFISVLTLYVISSICW